MVRNPTPDRPHTMAMAHMMAHASAMTMTMTDPEVPSPQSPAVPPLTLTSMLTSSNGYWSNQVLGDPCCVLRKWHDVNPRWGLNLPRLPRAPALAGPWTLDAPLDRPVDFLSCFLHLSM